MKKYILFYYLVCFSLLSYAEEVDLHSSQTTVFGSVSAPPNNNQNLSLIEFQKANLGATPQGAKDFFERGLAFYGLEDYTSALSDFNEAIKLNSSFGEAYLYRGRCKKILKDNNGALNDFKLALRLNPDSVNYYVHNGAAKESIGDYKAALEEYDKAIELNANLEEAYIGRGSAKTQLGLYLQAINDFSKAIQINPNNAEAYKKRGFVRYKLKRLYDSMSDHEKAKDLYLSQNNFVGYQSSIRSINLLREIMLKNQAEQNTFFKNND